MIDLEGRDDWNCGRPSLLALDCGVGEALDLVCSSVDVSGLSDEMTIYCGLAFVGVIFFVVPENGKGCSEHTNLASTAAERSKAQNN